MVRAHDLYRLLLHSQRLTLRIQHLINTLSRARIQTRRCSARRIWSNLFRQSLTRLSARPREYIHSRSNRSGSPLVEKDRRFLFARPSAFESWRLDKTLRPILRCRPRADCMFSLRFSLRRTLASYFQYYHRSRTHLSLEKDSPEPRSIQSPEMGRVNSAGCTIATNDGLPEKRDYPLPSSGQFFKPDSEVTLRASAPACSLEDRNKCRQPSGCLQKKNESFWARRHFR